VSDEPAAVLAARLAQAHRRVRDLPVENDEKARATRRLLAISDASKCDLNRAAARLDAFLQDLDGGRIGASDEPDEGARR
jgi:hypothetical protein